jgi:hypothetical protein
MFLSGFSFRPFVSVDFRFVYGDPQFHDQLSSFNLCTTHPVRSGGVNRLRTNVFVFTCHLFNTPCMKDLCELPSFGHPYPECLMPSALEEKEFNVTQCSFVSERLEETHLMVLKPNRNS